MPGWFIPWHWAPILGRDDVYEYVYSSRPTWTVRPVHANTSANSDAAPPVDANTDADTGANSEATPPVDANTVASSDATTTIPPQDHKSKHGKGKPKKGKHGKGKPKKGKHGKGKHKKGNNGKGKHKKGKSEGKDIEY